MNPSVLSHHGHVCPSRVSARFFAREQFEIDSLRERVKANQVLIVTTLSNRSFTGGRPVGLILSLTSLSFLHFRVKNDVKECVPTATDRRRRRRRRRNETNDDEAKECSSHSLLSLFLIVDCPYSHSLSLSSADHIDISPSMSSASTGASLSTNNDRKLPRTHRYVVR